MWVKPKLLSLGTLSASTAGHQNLYLSCTFFFPKFSLTSLHLACWYGRESVVKLLLDHNADVNAVDRVRGKRINHSQLMFVLV